MSAAYIMARAEIRTGLADWGDLEFLPRLRAFMASIRSDMGLTDAGRENLEATALRFAEGRLRLQRLVGSHPDIRRIALPSPIVVTGLPRSGTTALASAIATHPGLQSLRYGDIAAPFVQKRRPDGARHADALEAIVPGIHRLHDMSLGAHADDTELLGLTFAGYGLEWLCHAPKWRDGYFQEDQQPAYRYLKLALQALTFLNGGVGRWVIKNPQHMEQLPALSAVFPDALLVVADRDAGRRRRSMARVMDALVPNLRSWAIPVRYWDDRFVMMRARFDRDSHLFPNRIELSDWTADQVAAPIWMAANLQPMAGAT